MMARGSNSPPRTNYLQFRSLELKEMEKAHVVVHPLAVQGHMKPLLCLAKLLSEDHGLYVTFLITHHTHSHLPNISSLSNHFPNLHFEFISDGLPDDHTRSLSLDYFSEIKTKTKPHLKQFLLNSLSTKSMSSSSAPPVTCIITDQYLPYTLEVAEELKIPIFAFVAHSASYLLAYLFVVKLIQDGRDLPLSDDNASHEINGVSGLEGLLRTKNLPPLFWVKEIHNPSIQLHLNNVFSMNRSSGLLINTFDDLEPKSLPHVGSHFHKTYTVGPLHAFLNSKISQNSNYLMDNSHASYWKADQNCISWLDSQPLKSVLYVSIGSLAKASIAQLMEFWHGLVNSGYPFLWVIRTDAILYEEGEENVIPKELQMGAKESGYVVDWAPQEQVLGHDAIGGFLTHCGWNSTLESIVARIPLICWPHTSDQNLNADIVSKVLRIGIELEACDRLTIERTIVTMMGSKREELQISIDGIAKCAQDCIGQGGSSNHNLEILVADIKKMKSQLVE